MPRRITKESRQIIPFLLAGRKELFWSRAKTAAKIWQNSGLSLLRSFPLALACPPGLSGKMSSWR
jgi:hypothetical protein